MATQPTTGLTYEDLQRFPEDNVRRELIDGELFVTPSPSTRHQRAVIVLGAQLFLYAREHGGEVFPAPLDVLFSDTNVVEPDVLFVRADHLDRVESRFIRSAPDVVVEISSPGTRRIDLTRKRDLYERFGVPEYWFVDLQLDRVEVRRLEGDHYGPPAVLTRGQRLESVQLLGFGIAVDELLGSPDEP